MTAPVCDYAHCKEPAAVALRFGKRTPKQLGVWTRPQSYVIYCAEHARVVKQMFWTRDEQSIEAYRRHAARVLKERAARAEAA